ncbi:MAG: lipoyl synthase [Candidatus Hydrogenedens sp.]|nr:lipoyl synthase [Candidatus Hydrogenedens sp.]
MPAAAPRFPDWIRRPWPSGKSFEEVKQLLAGLDLSSVCQSAHCPNQSECWGRGTATFMVMGNVCTRHCTYCSVHSGRPDSLDADEPAKVAEAVRRLNLAHVVLTSVTRDDLPDGGANHIAAVVQAIRAVRPDSTIELLVQDFCGEDDALRTVVGSAPEIFSHNIETVRRLHGSMRDRRFTYDGALGVLRRAAEWRGDFGFVKSAFMLGCGEKDEDIDATLRDLRESGCHAVSIGQYLQPTPKHRAVQRFVPPEEFDAVEKRAYEMGFLFAVAGPFVRSSYKSETLLAAPGAAARLTGTSS